MDCCWQSRYLLLIMRTITGYRLSITGIAELQEFVDGFRNDALRVMSRHYCHAVADEAVRRIDLHKLALQPREPAGNPVHDATLVVRELVAAGSRDRGLDFDCELSLHLTSDGALIRLVNGHRLFRPLLESRAGVSPFHWATEFSDESGYSRQTWEERGKVWASAFPTPRLGVGLTFHLLDGTLPMPRWTSVRRALPELEIRLRRTARAKLWNISPHRATNDISAFRAWLATAAGKRAYHDARSLAARLLPVDFERPDLIAYGEVPKPKPLAAKARVSAPAPQGAKPIDHADVLETPDGRVFVAVMDAGLSTDDRLFLQLSGQHLSFIQAGRDFGQVGSVPFSAVEMLRAAREVTVVEIRHYGASKELKAKHSAMIRDATPETDLAATMQRWRGSKTANSQPWSGEQ